MGCDCFEELVSIARAVEDIEWLAEDAGRIREGETAAFVAVIDGQGRDASFHGWGGLELVGRAALELGDDLAHILGAVPRTDQGGPIGVHDDQVFHTDQGDGLSTLGVHDAVA